MNSRNASEPKSLAFSNRTGKAQCPYGFMSHSRALGTLARHFTLWRVGTTVSLMESPYV